MKFTDGAWLVRPGLQPHYPAEVHRVQRDGDALVVHAPTRPVRHRGDTLQGPLLTVRLDSPLEGVVRVRISHFTGSHARGPQVPLNPVEAPEVEIEETDGMVALHTGALTARLAKQGGWSLRFERPDGTTYTHSGFRSVGYVENGSGGPYMHEQLDLAVGENVYGLGERFTAFVKNGQVVENWNRDGGTGSEQAYKCVPFYLTNRGYGVLVNDTGPVSFEVGSERVSRVQFSLPGEQLEYFVIAGPTPKDVLNRLTALTGRPALPPAWSFGLWLTTSFTTQYDEATVNGFIEGMRSRDLPLHVFHYDCFWMREFCWCDFQWDERTFPDPAGQLQRLHEKGLRVSVWINPYIGQMSRLFDEAVREGYLLKKPNGDVWQTDLWQPGMGIVDFTNPAARDWFVGHLRRLLAMGVDSFKTDFGERIPTDVVWHDGSDPDRMHNHYAVLYNEAVFELLREVRGDGEAVLFARSAHTGGQKFPVHWGGDCNSTFESMAESLRGGLSLGACGFGFWSHDIGGFEGQPDPAVYKRWVAFGLLSSHSRMHGSTSYRVPWAFDEESCDVLRYFTRLKCRLMPYLFAKAVEAHRTGVPLMRAMVMEFCDDRGCDALDRQYMLGDRLLVAPVFSVAGEVDFYLPTGSWVHLLTGEERSGGWHRTHHDFMDLPLYVRTGSVLPLGGDETRPDYDWAEGVTLAIYRIEDGDTATCTVPGFDGAAETVAAVSRVGETLIVTLTGRVPSRWSVRLLPGDGEIVADPGASALTIDVP
ncbi:alpha-xylosidase [Synoicihabitans lomoniglobus]|uniref:alpha-D-xyloside xylohydrolase n=1 Tax=Synoicihabitans lomoniglobus TaxID=2909285 RepID=A0AAF0CPD9_9BACT|nr:alpha-xylosidase [Opitutaceae bacterium LMO-M01]WED64234.1 alpha-xylosidase [Opitutaceae bacterium LMO-M01]